MVAPTRTMVPSSMSGRKASCCALLKRWISSTKSRVPRPFWRRRRAVSKIFFRSATPVKMALICTKARSVASARRRAMVVLPTPGGPQKTIEPRLPSASIRPSGPSGPRRWSWPTTSLETARAQAVGEGARRLLRGRGAVAGRGVEEVGHERDWPAEGGGASGLQEAARFKGLRGFVVAGSRLESGWKVACHFSHGLIGARHPHGRCRCHRGPLCVTAKLARPTRAGSNRRGGSSSAATRALSPAPLAAGSRSTSSMIAIGAMSP